MGLLPFRVANLFRRHLWVVKSAVHKKANLDVSGSWKARSLSKRRLVFHKAPLHFPAWWEGKCSEAS